MAWFVTKKRLMYHKKSHQIVSNAMTTFVLYKYCIVFVGTNGKRATWELGRKDAVW